MKAPAVPAEPRVRDVPVIPLPLEVPAAAATPQLREAPVIPVPLEVPRLPAVPRMLEAPELPPVVQVPAIPTPPPMTHLPATPISPPMLGAPAISAPPPAVRAPIAPAEGVSSRPSGAPPAARQGAAGSRPDSPIFNNPRQPPSDAPIPGMEPRIDLEAARARAREIAREGTGNRAILPFPMPPLPERKSKEELAIEKAWKPDCRDAYKSLGLLAVVPLIANEFGEGKCRW
jgi:hypothetical protein